MCGGGNVNFPDPNEVGQAQWNWNNLNQYTPYGSMEFQQPTFDTSGNIVDQGSMTQSMDPGLLALQEQMMGLRGNALGQMSDFFGGGGSGFNFGGGQQGGGQQGGGGYPWGSWTPGAGGGGTTGGEYGLQNHKGGRVTPGGDGSSPTEMLSRNGGSGRVTPDDPNSQYQHKYSGSNVYDSGPGMNSLFASSHAPGIGTGFDTQNLPGLLGANDLTGERERITQGKFDRLRGLLDPVFAEKNTALAEQMANRGMPVGAEEYNIQSEQLGQQENEAYMNAALDADQAGLAEMQGLAGMSAQQRAQLFGEKAGLLNMNNQARNQAFTENMGVNSALLQQMLGQGQFGLQQEGQQFNQLAAMLGMSGVPGAGADMSQFYGPGPVDMMNAYGMQNQGSMFNAGNQITGSGLMSGLFGLGGSALGGGMFG